MALHLHRAPRTDLLADALGDLLAPPLADPFGEEVVVVPAKGVERWLTQRLSHRLGATRAAGRATASAPASGSSARARWSRLLLGRERDDPWDPDRLVWPLLGHHRRQPRRALVRHPRPPPRPRPAPATTRELRRNRRYSVAIRLAGLFASYAVQRPAAGHRLARGRDTDGAGRALDDDLALAGRAVAPAAGRGCDAPPPDVRHAATMAGPAGRRRPGSTCPPGCPSSATPGCPVTEVELLGALGEHRDVHLYLPAALAARCGTTLAGLGGVRRRATTTPRPSGSATRCSPRSAATPASCARTLDGVGARPATGGADRRDRRTLLGWLQHDLRANHAPTNEERAGRAHDPADRSLQVHACHGPARQVDVLREVLVGLLQDDPTLEPRDILVMCPDIETYAPLISAGFGLRRDGRRTAPTEAGHPAHRLRVKLADRALTSTNPLLAVAGVAARAAGGRVTASDVLDLAAGEPCRRRFGFTDDDLDRLSRWVSRRPASGGGSTQRARASFSMERFAHNTWRTGLDRILLGVAMSGDDHRHLGRGLPLDDVGSNEIDLAGRLAELVDRLERCLTGLDGGPDGRRVDGRACATASATLTDVPADDAWQLPQFERELARAARRRRDRGGDSSCGSPTCAPCSAVAARPAGRPAPTSAPAR